jgi:hypothetical protein
VTVLVTWSVVAAAIVAFAGGWLMHRWQCSRKRECPLYNEYALAKWKRDITTQGKRSGRRCDGDERPSPPEGDAA